MDSEVKFHLSGGIFFNLILAARKTRGGSQDDCLKDLLCIYDRSAKGLMGNSLKTIASRFRNCDPELNSEYIRFTDAVTVDAFTERMKNDYASVLQEMKNYADKYLDLETHGKWLVKALLQLIEMDEDIKDTAKLLVVPGGYPAYPSDIADMKSIYFYSFLLGVWHYICSYQNAENGQETYFALSESVGESRPRDFKKERIGFQEQGELAISYELEIEGKPMPVLHGLEKIVEAMGGEVPKVRNVHQIFESKVVEPAVKADRTTFTIEYTSMDKEAADRRVSAYFTYLQHAYDKHKNKKTFLYETQRPFEKFFVCNDVKKRSNYVGSGMKGDPKPEPPIENATVESFPEDQRFIILSGTGGLGKSMMMTHFMLDTLKESIRKKGIDGKIPIFVILRDYDPTKGELIDFVFNEFKRHDPMLHLTDLISIMVDGKAVVLFDGLDEIKKEFRDQYYHEMDVLVDNYPDSMYIISSRPTMNLRAFNRFMVYDLQPFNLNQSVEMIERLDQSVIDEDTQKDFIEDLRRNRFKFNYDERTEFLGNPLFLTIMLLAYEGNHDIPTQRYLFYEQAYEAMAKKHDATKNLTREFATGLNSRDFQKYFGEFCAITYEQQLYDFTPEQIIENFQAVIDANGLKTTPEAFIEDVTGKICLIFLDGGKYCFVHRSFQEYFVAYFFSKQLEQHFDAVLEMFMCRDEGDHDSMVLPMLYGMDSKKTELCVFLPYLTEMFEHYSGENGYQLFLQRHYPMIFYEQGDTEGCPDNISESSIYDFIVNTYDIKQIVDGADLPELDVMVDKEFVYYEPEYGDGTKFESRLIESFKLPAGYEEQYEAVNDEPVEIVGRSYEIDVMRAYESRDIYHEVVDMLEADDFPLKKEFVAIKAKYEELKTTYTKKESKKSFISRFH